ncbi:MAG: tRNA (adenosine(37)-N6)-threonylcarbamoyltransferase complex dimerization subunit type 1 TsaB [Clostridia bacterium]|nr:tRNA (adenosine(37)-N6)-threonylcarbamoyltransferase complex dimerization subunit type 1 TsaB [Clostridia bacterium]
MLIAALDSTAVTATAAIAEINDGKLGGYALFTVKNKLTHSETLLPLLENAMKQYGVSPSDVDLYAVSAGPGSFTGVRIGAATVKGLAFTEKKPCVSVSALEAMARSVGRGYVCPVMDARRDQFYTALFKDGKRITEDSALAAGDIISMLDGKGEITICGDGRDKFLSLCENTVHIFPASDAATDQNALSVALCGYDAFVSGGAIAPEELKPVYLRMPQAERERIEREGRG